MSEPVLTVLTGPSAVGKGTVVQHAKNNVDRLWLSVSATTRDPRPGEVDGEHYHFVTDAEFDELIEAGRMLEYAVVHGHHRYGTPADPVEKALADGLAPLLEIDLDGARQVREHAPNARFVFMAPPSWDELVRRLTGRGTETPEQIARRLETARTELAAQDEFDHVIVNTDVSAAAAELVDLMGLSSDTPR